MSNQSESAEEEESWINRMSRFMSVHIKENGPGILPRIPFFSSQPVPAAVPADQQQQQQQQHHTLTHKVTPYANPHFRIKESAAAAKDNAQMTIFYGGQVIVLNLPPRKAEAIIHVASKSSSVVPASLAPSAPVVAAAAVAIEPLDSTGRTSTHASGNTASEVLANRQSLRSNVADLPIQRKASLSLFFEKRKNRIIARAPYNVKGKESSKSAGGKP